MNVRTNLKLLMIAGTLACFPHSSIAGTGSHLVPSFVDNAALTPDVENPRWIRGRLRTDYEVVQKFFDLTGSGKDEAIHALSLLYEYGSTYRTIYSDPDLNDAQRRVRIRDARRHLETSLRKSMKANDVRKWLHYSIPRAPYAAFTNHFL